MTLRASRATAAVALCALSSTGCSILFATRPPGEVRAPNYPVECTSWAVAPVLDTLCAAYTGVSVTLQALRTPDDPIDASDRRESLKVFIPVAAACGASAVLGWRWRSRCRSVKRVNASCIDGDLAACRTLTPGWAPPGERWNVPPGDPASAQPGLRGAPAPARVGGEAP